MPTLRTQRLLLRPYRPEDAPGLAAHRSDPEVARYVQWTPPYTLPDAQDLIERTQWGRGSGHLRAGEGVMIAIEFAEAGGEVIGDCSAGLLADDPRQGIIGFTLSPSRQGQGYITEAVRAVLHELFTCDAGGLFAAEPLHRVSAVCGADNAASVRVLERVGMRREAHFIESVFFKGAWGSEYHYAVLRSEWRH